MKFLRDEKIEVTFPVPEDILRVLRIVREMQMRDPELNLLNLVFILPDAPDRDQSKTIALMYGVEVRYMTGLDPDTVIVGQRVRIATVGAEL